MKTHVLIAALAAGTVAVSANAAPVLGDIIGLDFGSATTSGNFNATTYATIADLIDTTGALTGVSYTSTGDTGFSGFDGAHQAVAQAGYNANHLDDWIASFRGLDTYEFTLDGLDPSLSYNLELVVAASTDSNVAGTGSNQVRVNGVLLATTPGQSATANSVVSLTGLTLNDEGKLVVNHTGGVASGWSAARLTVVPEPSSLALGLVGLGVVAARRRRG